MSTPLISVIVPLFGAERFIGDALGSLLVQDVPDWEAVVIDDGSTDRGPEIARAFAARDPRFRVISQPNAGLPAARNSGIDAARGRWLRFLDADDRVPPGGLRTLLELGDRASDGLVCGGAAYIDESGTSMHWSFTPGCSRVPLDLLLQSQRFQVSAAMVNRSALSDLRFDPASQGAEDWDLWLRLGERGLVWDATDRDVVEYRLRPTSMSRDHAAMGHAYARVAKASYSRLPDSVRIAQPVDRTIHRLALDRATCEAFSRSGSADRAVRIYSELLESHSGSPRVQVSPELAAASAWWSGPYADCRPPTAWQEPSAAVRYARAASSLWRALIGARAAPTDLEPRARAALATMLTPPEEVASRITDQIPRCTERLVLHGLGRNAAALIDAIRRLRPVPILLGRDDAHTPGRRVEIGGVEVTIIGPAEVQTAADSAHVLTPTHAPALESALPESGTVLKWARVQADLSGRAHARLMSVWPRPECHASTEAA